MRDGRLQVEIGPGGCVGMSFWDESVLSLHRFDGVGFKFDKVAREIR